MHRYRRAEADGLDRGRDTQPSVGGRYQKGNDPCDRQKHQNQYCFHFFTWESIQPMVLSQPSGKGLPSSRNTLADNAANGTIPGPRGAQFQTPNLDAGLARECDRELTLNDETYLGYSVHIHLANPLI